MTTTSPGSIPLGDGIELRPLRPEHAEEFLAHIDRGREFVGRFIRLPDLVTDAASAHAFLSGYAQQVAADTGRLDGIWVDGVLVGGVLLRSLNVAEGIAEVGCWLEPAAVGRGLVIRGARALIGWAIEARGIHRVEWRVAPENMASIAVARRLGMRRDGVLRERYLHRGTRYDAEVWSLLAPEWEEPEAPGVGISEQRVFTEETRRDLQNDLIDMARRDGRIAAAALVGSSATGRQDAWSDIDLALRLGPDADRGAVIADWTDHMRRHGLAVDHLDVARADTTYRVFLRADTLQVDISFWAHDRFRPTGPRFSLLFGEALDADPTEPLPAGERVGWAWLYALHARSAIARGRPWQAVHMIAGMRDQVIALACLRHGLPPVEGRGVDDLPPAITDQLALTLVGSRDTAALRAAFAATCELFGRELVHVDRALADRIEPVLQGLVASAAHTARAAG